MNNLPRISMFGLPLKRSSKPPDLQPMHHDIELQYHQSAAAFESEFNQFLSLRKEAMEPSIDYIGLSKQMRYYAQLQLAMRRFRFSQSTQTAVVWRWRDAFANNEYDYTDLRYEQASVLYNIAALHTTLAVKERRADAESMKKACNHFQCASWVFENITEKYLPLDESADLRIDIIRALQFIMLCQAQECVTEKSLLDNVTANTTAKLAQQLTQSYGQLSEDLSKPAIIATLPPKFQKEWLRRCQIKAEYYAALADYHEGLSVELAEKYGSSIAWFRRAEKRATEAIRLSKIGAYSDPTFPVSVSSPFRTNAEMLFDVIHTKLEAALKDNNFIYHQTVPPIESLGLIKAATVVKGIPFDPNDPEIRGPDIFQRLVPMKTLEAASIYSERKANLLRGLTSEVDEKDAAIQQFLSGLDLDPALLSTPDPALSQEFYDLCAQVGGGEQSPEKLLSAKMQELINVSADKDEATQHLAEKIEATKCRVNSLSALRSEVIAAAGGVSITDVIGGLVTKVTKCRTSLEAISDRYQSLLATVQQAALSNVQLRQLIMDHVETLDRMTVPPDELAASLPSVKHLIEDPSTKETLAESTRLLGKVCEMQQQRSDLVNQLRHSLHNDDVTADLLTLDQLESSSLEQLFEARLVKNHDSLVKLIRLNLSAQVNIESALMELNAKFAPRALELRTTREKRLEQFDALIASGRAFGELMRKCDEGLAFYEQITARLDELNQELDEIDSTVNEALEEQESKMKQQMYRSQQQQQQQRQQEQQHQTAMLTGTSGPPTGARWPAVLTTRPDRPLVTLGEYMAAARTRGPPPAPMPHSGFRPPTVPPNFSQLALRQQMANEVCVAQRPGAPLTCVSPAFVSTAGLSHSHPHQQQHPQSAVYPPVSQLIRQRAPPFQQPTILTTTAGAVGPPVLPPMLPSVPPSQRLGPAATGPLPSAPQFRPHGGVPGQPVNNYGQQFQAGAPTQHHLHGPPGYPQYPRFPHQQPQQQPRCRPHPQQAQHPRQSVPVPVPQVPVTGSAQYSAFPTATAPSPGNFPMWQPPGQPFPQPPFNVSGIPTPQQQQQRMPSPTQRFNQPNNINPNVRFVPQQPTTTGVRPSQLPWQQQQQQFPPAGGAYQAPPQPPPPQQLVSVPYQGPPHGHPSGQQSQAQVTSGPNTTGISNTTDASTAPTATQTLNVSNHNVTTSTTVAAVTAPPDVDHHPADHVTNTSTSLLQPQVLTEADLQAQRREDRIRASFSGLSTGRSDSSGQPPVTVTTGVAPAVVPLLSSESSSCSSSLSASGLNPPGSGSLDPECIGDLKPSSSAAKSSSKQTEPLSDPLVLNRFIAATENFLTWLEEVSSPASGKALAEAWSRLTSVATDFAGKRPTQAAALCCAGRNRQQQHVPYDNNRVILASLATSSNDYINASHIDLGSDEHWAPRYIVSQAPMPKLPFDYWTMLMEQACEVVVLLLPPRRPNSPSNLLSPPQGEGQHGVPEDPLHIPAHLPANKLGSRLCLPGTSLEISLQGYKESTPAADSSSAGSWTERILTLRNLKANNTRTVVHLTYQGPLLTVGQDPPSSAVIDRFHKFVQHVHMFYRQQRVLSRPIAVTCEFGAGLSGIFVTASLGILHLERMGGRFADIVELAGQLCKRRRGVLQDPRQLVIAGRVVGQAAVEMAAKRDVAVGPRRQRSSEARPATAERKPTGSTETRAKPAPANPIDAIFSGQAVGIDTLLSVMDKWSTGEPQQQVSNSEPTVIYKDGDDHRTKEPLNELSSSNKKTTKDQNGPTIKPDNNNPLAGLEHLVNLSNLTANVKKSVDNHAKDDDDPFARLDPLSNAFKNG